jgi:hypothetical protein
LAVEPAEQHGDGSRIVTQAMACTGDQPKLGRTMCLRQLTSVDRGNAVVVVAVHHEQRTRRKTSRRVDGSETTQLAGPLVE